MKVLVMVMGVVVVMWGLIFMNGFVSGEEEDRDFEGLLDLGRTAASPNPLIVKLTLIRGAAAKGAVCLDGTLPGYHFHPGFGKGANNWLVHLQGGGWCNSIYSCVFRKTTRLGSSKFMERQLPFTGILSNESRENPDFYNWNRVLLRYCDGASFSGEGRSKEKGLYFRGQRIFEAAMQELMAKGMRNARQALLSGCSAGGLASILHCDEFASSFPKTTQVKCLSDAGLFLNVTDAAGGLTMRNFFAGVVRTQGVARNLPSTCTRRSDPVSCFFAENLIAGVKTPLFLLKAAYDVWQFGQSLVPKRIDPRGTWKACKTNPFNCNSTQIRVLQDFRLKMLGRVKRFGRSPQNGLFINSCFAHCQAEKQDAWFRNDSPRIGTKRIAESGGEWYFDRSPVKAIDCPFPCDKTCHNLFAPRSIILP